MKSLTKAAAVVEALGGPEKVAALTDANTSAVWNWFAYFEAFPANTYKIMIDALKRRGYTAPPHLWKMRGFEKRSKKHAA
jgi:hypothetical protein